MQTNSELLSNALANLSRKYDFYQPKIEEQKKLQFILVQSNAAISPEDIKELRKSILEFTPSFISFSLELAEVMQVVLCTENDIITPKDLDALRQKLSDFNKICEPYREEFERQKTQDMLTQTQKMISTEDLEALNKTASDFNKICEPYRQEFENQKIQYILLNQKKEEIGMQDFEALRNAISNFGQEPSSQTPHHAPSNKSSNKISR